MKKIYLLSLLVCMLISIFSVYNVKAINNEMVALTNEEQQYIKEHPTLKVVCDGSWRPIEYKDDQEQYAGIMAEVFSRLETYTSFKFQYIIEDSYNEALDTIEAGKADLISGFVDDQAYGKECHLELTQSYLTINSSVISKDSGVNLYDNNEKIIAVVEDDSANEEIKNEIKNVTLLECESNEDCMDAVKDGKADMAIVASYCAEYLMSIPTYHDLNNYTISHFSWKQTIGVNTNDNRMIIGILNKGIQKLNEVDINEAVYEGIVNAAYDNNFMLFVYKHPIAFIGVVVTILLIIAALIGIIYIVRRNEQKRIAEDGTRLKLALERTNLCIWELDLHTMKITKIDNEHEKHGFNDLREGIPQAVIDHGYVHPEDVSLVERALQQVVAGEQGVQGCWRIKELNGKSDDTTYWWEQVLFHIVYDEKHRPIKVIGVSEDVTNEKNAQRDSLTSVYNRNSFETKANSVLNERRNSYLQCAYLILDLDGFKKINDTYGHSMGDRVLISVGATLNKAFRSSDIVGRLGGDEFTIFMTSISKPEDAIMKAEQVVENIGLLKDRDNFPFNISCSLGIVVGTKGKDDLSTLYKKADYALYDAKHKGKNQYCIYQQEEQ